MKFTSLANYALGVSAAATLIAGCTNGGSSFGAPSSVTSNALSFVKKPTYQFMATAGGIFQYDYPESVYPVRQFDGGAAGECADILYGAAKRNFWVTVSGSQSIEEFNVDGSSPIKTLTTSAGEPVGCAMDPISGNLAATIIGNGPDGGNIDGEVYKYPAGGSPVATLTGNIVGTPIGFIEVRQ
jgi:hypothetical protein